MNEVKCAGIDELPGKTISHFHFGGGGGSIGLRFTDGTVIQFDCRVSDRIGYIEREPFLYPEDFSIAALEAMFGQKMASYIDGRKKQLQDAMERWRNANEDQAREQYERLKARFEPKTNGPTNFELAS